MDATIEQLLEKARKAQAQVANYSQQQIDDVCLAVGWQVYNDENIAKLARLAVDETGMGRYEDKIAKHKGKVMGVLDGIRGAKTVGLIEVDETRGLRKYAKPVGVVGALCPVTNPTATPASNGISVLKGRNAVIFAPHPKAKRATTLAVEFMRTGLRQVGAPEDLVQVISEPSIELTAQLMAAVDLVVATGGGAMVRAAYSSGTPAYGVGPGNACQIIAEDAELDDVTAKLFMSKCFDNATSCSSENSIVVQSDVYDDLMQKLLDGSAYLATGGEREMLKNYMWKKSKSGHLALNSAVICQSAEDIAKGVGIAVPAGTKMLLVEGEADIEHDQFSAEKLSPVLTVYRYGNFEEALGTLVRLTNHTGTGHSCGIFTFNESYIDRLGKAISSSRILVRQPMAQGNGGAFFNGMPSTTTLGCGTWGGNITTENIHYKHFINVSWLAMPLSRPRPTNEDMWGEFWQRHGETTKE